MNRETNDLLTVQDIAAESGLTESAIRVAMRRGRVPYVLRYGRKLIPRADWEAYRQAARPGRPRKVPAPAQPQRA